jgi:hypothetical protein
MRGSERQSRIARSCLIAAKDERELLRTDVEAVKEQLRIWAREFEKRAEQAEPAQVD